MLGRSEAYGHLTKVHRKSILVVGPFDLMLYHALGGQHVLLW